MKKNLLLLLFLISSTFIYSQSFNSGTILKPGHLSVGINPVMVGKDLGLYMHGGYGILSYLDLDVKYGMFEGDDYVGGDLEWQLRKTTRMDLSLVTGFHTYKNHALDLGVVVSFPFNSQFTFFTGIDGDINFNQNQDYFYWLPVGLEINLEKRAGLFLELDLPIVDFAPRILSGGLTFYL